MSNPIDSAIEMQENKKKPVRKLNMLGLEHDMIIMDESTVRLTEEDLKKCMVAFGSAKTGPASKPAFNLKKRMYPPPSEYIPFYATDKEIKHLAKNLDKIGLDIKGYNEDQVSALLDYVYHTETASKSEPSPAKTEWCYIIETQEPQPCMWALQGTEENDIFENPGRLDNYLFLYVDNEVDEGFISERITELYESLRDEFSGIILLPKGFTVTKAIKIRKITE